MKYLKNFKLFEKFQSFNISELRTILDILSDIGDSDIPHEQMFYIGDGEDGNGDWFDTFDINKDPIVGINISFGNQSLIDNKSVIQAFFNRLLEIIQDSDNKIYLNFFTIKKRDKRFKIIIDGINSSANEGDRVWNMDSMDDLWNNITDMGDLDVYISLSY